MPAGNPQFGETWTIRDAITGRDVPGLVADVGENFITLVSFSGNRFRVAPSRMMATWTFSRPSPVGDLPMCIRHGCSNFGFIRYTHAGHNEYTCPRHLPLGADGQRVEQREEVSLAERVRAAPCWYCTNPDPVEDLRYTKFAGLHFWACLICSARWASLAPVDDLHATREWFSQALPAAINEVRRHPNVSIVDLSFGSQARQLTAADQGFMEVPITRRELEDMNEIRLQLRGDPVPPRPEPRRAVQRLGGQPDRNTVSGILTVASTPLGSGRSGIFDDLYGAGRPRQTLQELTSVVRANRTPPAPPEETDEHLTPIPERSRWTQRKSGIIMEVVRCERTEDQSIMVVFRPLSEEQAPTNRMLQRDFVRFHRPYEEAIESLKSISPPAVVVLAGEEWESIAGETVIVISVDARREIVHVEEAGSNRRRPVHMSEFVAKRWRKVVRKTAYDRLLSDDEESL